MYKSTFEEINAVKSIRENLMIECIFDTENFNRISNNSAR